MSKILKLIFLVLISSNLNCKADDPPANPNFDYKTVTVELNREAKPSDTTVVVNKKSTVGVEAPFTKYALFDSERDEYFRAEVVNFNGQEVNHDGTRVTAYYVYDVYTYWRDSQLLLATVRHYYKGVDSLYKYYMKVEDKWKLVDGNAYGAEKSGFLTKDKLTKLLYEVYEKNKSQHPKQEKPSEDKSEGLTTNTKVVVGVVLGFVVLLLLVGLVFFLKK